jgi:hypothetical protein
MILEAHIRGMALERKDRTTTQEAGFSAKLVSE